MNAAEDSMAAQYETTIDSISFNDFVLKYPRGTEQKKKKVEKEKERDKLSIPSLLRKVHILVCVLSTEMLS